MQEEYGPIIKLPPILGRPGLTFVMDPDDIELLFRIEGPWPTRRTIETLVHYRKEVRPDIFKHDGLINEKGEIWYKMRMIVNPILLKPETVNEYIPVADEIATEFIDRIKRLRDKNNETPAYFRFELNKWALETVASLSLDKRLHILNCTKDDQVNKASSLIRAVDDMFLLTYNLEVKPSFWKYVATKDYKKLMKAYDVLTLYERFFFGN